MPLRTLPLGFRSPRPNIVREISPEPINLMPHCFMTDIDPSRVQQVFNIAQRPREADKHHDRKLDDFR